MKTKASKQPKQSRRTVQLQDIKPKQNPKGGGSRSFYTGGVRVASADVN